MYGYVDPGTTALGDVVFDWLFLFTALTCRDVGAAVAACCIVPMSGLLPGDKFTRSLVGRQPELALPFGEASANPELLLADWLLTNDVNPESFVADWLLTNDVNPESFVADGILMLDIVPDVVNVPDLPDVPVPDVPAAPVPDVPVPDVPDVPAPDVACKQIFSVLRGCKKCK